MSPVADDGTRVTTIPISWPFGFSLRPRGPYTLPPRRSCAAGPPVPESASLPASWSFDAPYLVQGDDTDIDMMLPAAVPADVVVLGLDGQPVSSTTMQYSAVTDGSIDLGAGLLARAGASDTIAATDGHFAPLLFGPSTLTFTLGDGTPRRVLHQSTSR